MILDMTWYADNNYACDNPAITLPFPPTTPNPTTTAVTTEEATTVTLSTVPPIGPPGFKGPKV